MRASGWLEATIYVWVIAALNIVYAVGIELGVQPAAFLLEGFFAAALCLLAIAGPGRQPWRIVQFPQTWGYGACTIGCEVFYYLMMAYVPPADASIFVRLNVIVAIAIGWLLFGRRVGGLRLVGSGVILLAIAMTAWWFPGTQVPGFALAAFATATVMASRNFFAEFHPWNRAARTVVEKMRVVGLVVLATATLGLVVVVGCAALTGIGVLPPSPALPTLAQLAHGPTIVLALILGCVLITAMQYLMFSAVVKITSEGFFAMMALTPPATLVLQEILGRLGLPGVQAGGWSILPFILLLMAGNVLIVWPAKTAAPQRIALPERPPQTPSP